MPFLLRLSNLQSLLSQSACDAIIIENQIDLYYLTGLNLSSGKLLASKNGAFLWVDNRYLELCKRHSPYPVMLLEESSLSNWLKEPAGQTMQTLAFDSENTTYSHYLTLQSLINELNASSRSSNPLNLLPLDNPVKKLRMIKGQEEIGFLKEAAWLGSQGFDYLCSLIKEGVTESMLSTELEIFWKKGGGQAVSFEPIIAFGTNSSMPHYRSSQAILKKGQAILVDIGVKYQYYHSDMTRMIFFGEPDPKILEIYQIALQAQKKALKLCRPGTLIGDLDKVAREWISSQGYGPNFTHSLGHGIGLEIHEYPMLRNKPPFNTLPLQEGMVITIEPGIYLPGIGGVRIEDTIAITAKGYHNLTERSTDPLVIE